MNDNNFDVNAAWEVMLQANHDGDWDLLFKAEVALNMKDPQKDAPLLTGTRPPASRGEAEAEVMAAARFLNK